MSYMVRTLNGDMAWGPFASPEAAIEVADRGAHYARYVEDADGRVVWDSQVEGVDRAGATYIVDMPGAFDGYFSGTGVAQGEGYSMNADLERGGRELEAAYKSSRRIKRGKGYSLRLALPSVEAAQVLAEYAETCITVNLGGGDDHSEIRASHAVLEWIAQATDGRVRWTGYYLEVDGERVT